MALYVAGTLQRSGKGADPVSLQLASSYSELLGYDRTPLLVPVGADPLTENFYQQTFDMLETTPSIN